MGCILGKLFSINVDKMENMVGKRHFGSVNFQFALIKNVPFWLRFPI